jgi:DNA repair exonuclease SbcCD ATPase subunit
MNWRSETTEQKLKRLRNTVEQVQPQLIEAEAELADRLAEVNLFEFEFEARVGHLLDKLADLEAEIERYTDLIETLRNRQVFGNAYLGVEKQYQRAWQKPSGPPPTPPAEPPGPATEAEIKRLYHQLARRFHPDLAADEADRTYRTEKMAAVNAAYAARSLTELQVLADEVGSALFNRKPPLGQTDQQLIDALEKELARCRRRLKEIEVEMIQLQRRPSVQLSLQVKLARRKGQDLLANLTAELEQRLAQKMVERDMLKVQIDQLGPDHGFIRIDKR